MNREEIEAAVKDKYVVQYPGWTNIRVTEVVLDTFDGNLAVVNATDGNAHQVEEICFVYSKDVIVLFETTAELARYLEQKAKTPFLERFFSRPILSGVVLLALLVGLFVIGCLDHKFDEKVLAILGGVVVAVTGFYFGSSSTKPT